MPPLDGPQSLRLSAAQTSHLSRPSPAAKRLVWLPAAHLPSSVQVGRAFPEQIRDIRPPPSPQRVSYDEDKKDCFIVARRKKEGAS